MNDNKKGPVKQNHQKVQHPETPKPGIAAGESATQQYSSLEQLPGLDQTLTPDLMLAADQMTLQQVIANPRALTPRTTPAIQRTVGNRTTGQLIARTMAAQQAAAEIDQETKSKLELELETMVNRAFSHQTQPGKPRPRSGVSIPEDEYEQTILQPKEKA
jgi:hypothetical protein